MSRLDMFADPSSTNNLNPYNHHEGRNWVKPWNAPSERRSSNDKHGALRCGEGDLLYSENAQSWSDYGASGCPQYVNEALSREDRERLRLRTNTNSHTEHINSFEVMPDSSGFDLDSQSNNKPDEEKKTKLDRKGLLMNDEMSSVEDRIRICAQKLFEEKIEREKNKEVVAREIEEYRKETNARFKLTLEKALNDQAVAFQKQIESQKHATQAEMEQLRQKEESDEIRFKAAVATKFEADRKAEREKARKIREKLEREKLEEEKRKMQIAQDAEELYAARLKLEADELAAKKKAEEDKIITENTAKVFELTRLLISIFEANEAKRDSKASRNTKCINSLVLNDVSHKLLAEVKKILDEKHESNVGEQKVVIGAEKSSDVERASLKLEGDSKSTVEAEIMYARGERDDCVSRDAAKHGIKTSSAKTKERSKHEKHAEKAKDGKVHGKHKNEEKKGKASKTSQAKAITALSWFVST